MMPRQRGIIYLYMLPAILRLINEGAIELSDLVEFSPELRRSVERVIEGETEQ